MRRSSVTTYSEEAERRALAYILGSAPGVNQFEVAGIHPKGGYWVKIQMNHEFFDNFHSYLETTDWMVVI